MSYIDDITSEDALNLSENINDDVYIFDFKNKKLRLINENGMKTVNESDNGFGLIYAIARNAFGLSKHEYDTMYG
jgi:hypothetical protein